MTRSHTTHAAIFLVLQLALSALLAGAEVDEGAAERLPWSGYWWPTAKGELLGPLFKYDALTGRHARQWHLDHNPPGPDVPEWHGYCHGWAAAALLEKEPAKGRTAALGERRLELGVADQKGWYAASHSADVSHSYGDRYGDGEGSEDPQDMSPESVWRLLKMYVGSNRVAIIMDLDAGPEVWNYPVYAYRVRHEPHSRGDGWRTGTLSLWAADDAVPPDYVGLVPHFETYTFEFQMRGASIVAGSSRWTGDSRENHPDFAWYPYVVIPENPEIDYASVKRLLKGKNEPATNPRPPIPGYDEGDDNEGERPIPISPPQLVAAVTNSTSDFEFDAHLNEFGRTRVRIGERVSIVAKTRRPGYLYLLHVNPRGELSLLFPREGEDNRIGFGDRTGRQVPAKGEPGFEVPGPAGNHLIKVIVCERPLLLTGVDRRRFGKLMREGNTPAAAPVRPFRFCPTRYRQVKSLLGDYLARKSIDDDRIGGGESARLPSGFAQDEIVFYVE